MPPLRQLSLLWGVTTIVSVDILSAGWLSFSGKAIALPTASSQTIPAMLQAQAPDTPSDPLPDLPTDLPDTIDQTIPERPSDPDDSIPDELPDSDTVPDLTVPQDSPTSEPTTVPDTSFFIDTITVVGSTVLEDEIAALVAEYEQRQVTFDELLTLRSRLTQLYIDNGYITSGAFLPSNQALTDGNVTIQVVEGSVEEIVVGGTRNLRQSYVRDRLALGTDTPLNQIDLQERLQLLQLDPFITQINAALTAGSAPGQNILQARIVEASPWVVALEANNYRPPSIGSNQLSTTVGRNNILGIGDRLSATYGITDGLDLIDVSTSLPVNPREGTVQFSFNSSDSQIITEEFEDLEIESETRSYGLSFRQPVVRSPNTEVGMGLGLDLRRRQTFILDDEPFSFSEGAEEGETNATIIRLFQDWVQRSPRQVLAARSQFNIGVDAFNATVNDSGTDARFFSWIGQFQWVQQVSDRNIIISRISAQLTPDSLLSLEQFSIGGVNTVRGYSQNELVADNGVLASIEARIPLTSNPQKLQLSPFLEVGTVWNNGPPAPENSTLVGLGLGLRWAIRRDLVLQVDYGVPLIQIDDDSDSLQSNGLYLSLRYQPF